MRNLIIHGRWTLIDAQAGLYEIEKIMTRSAARRSLGRDDYPDEEHPAVYMPMNAVTVARTIRVTENVTKSISTSI